MPKGGTHGGKGGRMEEVERVGVSVSGVVEWCIARSRRECGFHVDACK